MQWKTPSPVDAHRVLPPARDRPKFADRAPTFFMPPSMASSTSPSPSSPPPPYEDIHLLSNPIVSSPLPDSATKMPPNFHRASSHASDSTYRYPDAVHSGWTSGPNAGATVSRLRNALDSLDNQMASLVNQRQELEHHLEQVVRSQSPVFRLPEELLSVVFVIGVCDAQDEDPLLVSSLMLVCRRWRDVVVDTSRLWATICVSPHDSLAKARRRLSRSKSVPLDVAINFGPRIDNTSPVTENIVRAMDLFRPALWRTRSFRLSVPNRPQAHAALVRCKEDAPFLETLSICIYHSMQDDHYTTPSLPLFNGYTPRLQSCSFTSFNFGWDRRLLSGLQVLHLSGYWNKHAPSVDTIIDVLRGCPNLQELTLRNMSDTDPDTITSQDQEFHVTKSVKLPRLTKASFHYCGNIRTRLLLGQITFPALESLDLSYLDNLNTIIEHLRQQSLISLPLRHLRIESSFFSELKFVNLLKRLMSLKTLELVDVEDVSCFLLKNLSAPPASHPWVCPRLEQLNLDGCTAMEWDSLRSFVESRLSGKTSQRPCTSTTVSKPMSTASASAYIHAVTSARCSSPAITPHRLSSIDVTRCHQISKEMVQWLRMYVRDVRCESVKGIWGELMVP